MTSPKRTKHSEFMEWAKLCSQARFNLASSGVLSVPASEFPLPVDDFEPRLPKEIRLKRGFDQSETVAHRLSSLGRDLGILVGDDAPRSPELGERVLHDEQRGLRERRVIQRARLVARNLGVGIDDDRLVVEAVKRPDRHGPVGG